MEAVNRLSNSKGKVRLSKNYVLTSLFEHFQPVAEHLFSYDWTFAWAAGGTVHVTSDDPFLTLGQHWRAPSSYFCSLEIAMEGVRKVLPLTRHVCHVIGTGAPATRHIRLDRQTVRGLNLQQANHYVRWLIACDKRLVENISGRRG